MDTSIQFPKMLAVNPSAVQDLRRTSCHPDKKNNHLFFQVVISFFYYNFLALYDSMVLVWITMAVSPCVSERLSVVMVRVTLHEVSPSAIAIAVAMDTTRYLMAFLRRSF